MGVLPATSGESTVGDGGCLSVFASMQSASLTRFAFLLCGDRHRAENLVQDAFVALYRRFGDHLPVAAPVAYARGAAQRRRAASDLLAAAYSTRPRSRRQTDVAGVAGPHSGRSWPENDVALVLDGGVIVARVARCEQGWCCCPAYHLPPAALRLLCRSEDLLVGDLVSAPGGVGRLRQRRATQSGLTSRGLCRRPRSPARPDFGRRVWSSGRGDGTSRCSR